LSAFFRAGKVGMRMRTTCPAGRTREIGMGVLAILSALLVSPVEQFFVFPMVHALLTDGSERLTALIKPNVTVPQVTMDMLARASADFWTREICVRVSAGRLR